MKIAIIGAGYTGLGSAWHLLHSPFRPKELKITLFDEKGIGGGASGIAAGLLHPYVGRHAKLNWRGQEGMMEAKRLIQEASEAINAPVSSPSGFLRIATMSEQKNNFKRCSELNADVLWWDSEKCEKASPMLRSAEGIYIQNAQTVFSEDYMRGLWTSCKLQGIELCKQSIKTLRELSSYDQIIVAAGFGTSGIEELADLPMTLVKGHLLEMEWPKNEPPLRFPVSSQAYVVMNLSGKSCVVGSTYERDFESLLPDIDLAKQELLPKLDFLRELQQSKIIDCRAHVRVSTKNHLPICKKVNEKTWVLTGMGSKGLLYHALFARELSEKIFQNFF